MILSLRTRVSHNVTFFLFRFGNVPRVSHWCEMDTENFLALQKAIFLAAENAERKWPSKDGQKLTFLKYHHVVYQSTQNLMLISKMHNFIGLV